MLDPNIVNSLITSKRHISLFNAFFVLIQLIVIINLFINGNFLSFDSSSRFTTVRFAPLHNISLHLSCLLPFLLFISPLKSWKGMLFSPCWIVSNIFFLLSFFAAPSKGLLLQLIIKYLFIYSFRFNRSLHLNFSLITKIFRKLRLLKSLFLFLLLLISVVLISFLFASFTGGSFNLLIYRLTNGFDQLSLLNVDTIDKLLSPHPHFILLSG